MDAPSAGHSPAQRHSLSPHRPAHSLIHFGSRFNKAPLVRLDCDRLDDNASELFGGGKKRGLLDYCDPQASLALSCTVYCVCPWLDCIDSTMCLPGNSHRCPYIPSLPHLPQGTLLLNNVHLAPQAVLPLLQQTVDAFSRGSADWGCEDCPSRETCDKGFREW